MRTKILITGGGGMVGGQATFGVALGHAELDILNPRSIARAIERYKPRAIIHLAAMTDMLACERSPDQAYAVNVIGTYNLAKSCRDKNIKLAYLSTCAVFDGKKRRPYQETDQPVSVNVYGRTKWLGEIIVQDMVPDSLVLRTGWLFGGDSGVNKKFTNATLQKLKQGIEIRATSDRKGSPTYIPDLLQAMLALLNKKARGVVHVVNSGMASYFDIAKTMRTLGGFVTVPVLPVRAFEVELPELRRGKMEALISTKLHLRPWQDSLANFMECQKI